MSDIPYRSSTLRALLRSRNAAIGLTVVSVFVFCAVFAPIITGHDPYDIDLENKELPPSGENLFGTDNLGRDIFTRVVYGTRISLKVGILAMSISIVIGTILTWLGLDK